MNKRNVFLLAGGTFILAVALVYFFLLAPPKTKSPFYAIPSNAILIFQTAKVKDFEDHIINSALIQKLNALQLAGKLSGGISDMDTLSATNTSLHADFLSNPLVAAAYITKDAGVNYVFALQLSHPSKVNLEKITLHQGGEDPQIKKYDYQKETIFDLSFGNSKTEFAFAKVYGIFIFSTSSVLVENAVWQIKSGKPVSDDPHFSSVQPGDDKNAFATVYIHLREFADYLSMFTNAQFDSSIMKIGEFASWIGINLDMQEDGIVFNGFASASADSVKYSLNNLTGNAGESVLDNFIPGNTVFFHSVSDKNMSTAILSDLSDEKVKEKFIDDWSKWMPDGFLTGTTELFDTSFSKKTFVLFHIADSNAVITSLQNETAADTLWYRSIRIRELHPGDVLPALCGLTAFQAVPVFYAFHDQSLLFTTDLSQLKQLLDALADEQTLRSDQHYVSFRQKLSSSSNHYFYFDLSSCKQLVQLLASEKQSQMVSKNAGIMNTFDQLGIQFTSDHDNYIVNGFLNYEASPERKNGIAWKTALDYPVANVPCEVFNAKMKQENCVVEDSANQLYLISPGGNIIWKNKLTSPVMGTIHEVDFYGDGNSELLFNTKDAVQLLDMNGKPVEGFPISLTSEATAPMTVVTTGETGNYVFFIACANGNAYGFYKDGAPLPGWNPMKNIGTVNGPFAHAETGNTDVVLYQNSDGKIGAIDGNGKQLFSDRAKNIFEHPFVPDNTFAATQFLNFDNTGDVISINLKGDESDYKKITGFKDGAIADVDGDGVNDILFISGSTLHAQNLKGKNLFSYPIPDTANYFICTVMASGRNYTGICSVAADKIYLLDSGGKLSDGFPVEGSGRFSIMELPDNGDKMLITSENNFVLAYRIR